ncbi:MAG: GntR family transcriptional regulator [Clostridiales bacterium]|nr:GntR family transcriptional regulator [Clostridiales bacterium]
MELKQLTKTTKSKRGPAQEWVFKVIRSAIVKGEFPPGMQLKQDEISAQLNVSHIPVREALRQLEAQGLVTIHPNRGAQVSKLSRASIEDMMEVRAYLSASLLKSAVPAMTATDLNKLAAILEEQKAESDLMKVEKLNYRFHKLLTSRAKNHVGDIMIEIMHANIDRYLRSAFYAREDTRAVSLAEHEKIFEACEAHDAQLASDLLQQHILATRSRIPADIV